MSKKIIFVEQYDNKIKLLSGYCAGKYTAFWNEVTEDNKIARSVPIELGSREYILEAELDKSYSFVVKNNDIEIEKVSLYVGKLTMKETIDQIIRTYKINIEIIRKEYNNIIKKIDELDWAGLLDIIAEYYTKEKDDKKYVFYLLLSNLIERYNYNAEYNNGKHILFDKYFDNIVFNTSIDTVLFFSKKNGKRITTENQYITTERKIKTDTDILFDVTIFKENAIISKMFYFKPCDEIKLKLQQDKIYIEEKKKEALENNLTVPSVYVDMTEQEKTWYQYEQLIRPKNIFVKLPEVYADYPNIKFEFSKTKCLDLIKASSRKYYLTINEIDVLYDKNINRRIDIDPEKDVLFVNIRDYGLRDEPYFYFIEDEDGVIISDIHIFEKKDRTLDSMTDYFLKKKEIKMLNFKKNLNQLFSDMNTEPTIKSFINQAIDKILHNDDLVLLDLFSEDILLYKNRHDNLIDILYTLLVNQTMYGDYSKDFCSELKYKAYERTIALSAQKQDVLYCITQMGAQNDSYYEESYVAETYNTAVDFRIDNNTKYCFIRAIDLETSCISGFSLFDYTNKSSDYCVREYMLGVKNIG